MNGNVLMASCLLSGVALGSLWPSSASSSEESAHSPNVMEKQEEEKTMEKRQEQPLQRPRCTVLLKEVTTDRWIHYLLRPCTALGANEVIWLGKMKAKGQVKGVGNYGKAMKGEIGVPLTNLTTLFQAERYLTSEVEPIAAQCVDRKNLCVIGVCLKQPDLTQEVPVPVEYMMNLNFADPLAQMGETTGSQPQSIALLFSGPDGELTEDEMKECDIVTHVLPPNAKKEGGSVNISALVAVVLHRFSRSVKGLGFSECCKAAVEKNVEEDDDADVADVTKKVEGDLSGEVPPAQADEAADDLLRSEQEKFTTAPAQGKKGGKKGKKGKKGGGKFDEDTDDFRSKEEREKAEQRRAKKEAKAAAWEDGSDSEEGGAFALLDA